ncbi:hypothetical protein KY343_02275 [Candidatus Woesearchaeota archaeon]|nr:hypothetical protein [Candidatus Woesearchaeota archaeon]
MILAVFYSNQNKYLDSIKLGGEWFLNNQNEDFVYYEYDIIEKNHTGTRHPLREMGAMWSVAKLNNYFDDKRYYNLTQKGLLYFDKFILYDPIDDFVYANFSSDDIKLGYSAFMILTLLETDYHSKEFLLDKFANGILYLQNEDGSFNTFFYSNKSTGIDYYPGEALFALISLYQYKKDQRYLQTVEKAFPYYSEYWKENANTAFVPWQSRAYKMLYLETEEKKYADFVFEMNDFMLDEHYPKKRCQDFDFDRSMVTAVYIEGVNQAYELAKLLGDKEREECYANFIREGADYIISLQIKDKSEKQAIGGFLGDSSLRVDRNQHAVIALIEARELGII